MERQRTSYGWVLRIDAGEELFETLRAFAVEHDVRAGTLSGIGAVGEAELGFFVRESRSYIRRVFRGEHELLSLVGNVSVLEGSPFPHCHLTLAGPDFVAYGGHLFRAVVSVTCEVHVVTSPGAIVRASRPDLGYHPLAPDGG
ncbi:MAG TPA: PPC domain-containing DNA-binding protein [Candidatus Eisenbacteria bacterium]|jgi:predicted DNA-binding protein with PD1-like motif